MCSPSRPDSGVCPATAWMSGTNVVTPNIIYKYPIRMITGPTHRRSAHARAGTPPTLGSPVRRCRDRKGESVVSNTAWHSETEQLTLGTLLERRVEQDPDGAYLHVCGTALTARQVDDSANRLANAFTELGVRAGDRVATLIENSPEATLSWWGTVQAGAIAVPVNTAYKGEYLRHQLADSGSRVLVVEASLADRASDVLGQIDGLAPLVVIG